MVVFVSEDLGVVICISRVSLSRHCYREVSLGGNKVKEGSGVIVEWLHASQELAVQSCVSQESHAVGVIGWQKIRGT